MNLVRGIMSLILLSIVTTGSALAQVPADAMASQSLRPYAHVFAAYAIAWLLIGGWIFSINRRLGKLESRHD